MRYNPRSIFTTSNVVKKQLKRPLGFTLIEVIVGIVVLSTALTIIPTLILPATIQSAEQIHQIRAAELGQSMLNEILSKAYDENSDMAGGVMRCGIESVDCSNTMGTEEFIDDIQANGPDRANFDDVDDYHSLSESGPLIKNALGETMGDLYQGFQVDVSVCIDSDYDGCDDTDALDFDNSVAKLIKITVTTPQNFKIHFASYRANF
jgi:MSHA pilin protein MshD